MQQFIMALGSNCTNHKQALLTAIHCKEIKIIHRKKTMITELSLSSPKVEVTINVSRSLTHNFQVPVWLKLKLFLIAVNGSPRWGHYGCQAPVPLSIFRSNSKFDENSKRSSFKYIRPIPTIFCTRHDSDTVVTYAKYRCNRPRIFYTRVFWIFIEFRIRSKYA